MAVLAAERVSTEATGYSAEEATLALLRVVWILGIAVVAVGIRRVARRWWSYRESIMQVIEFM